MSVSDFNLLTGSSSPLLASGDVLAFTDVSDATQSPQGSTVKATLTQFYAAIPVPIVVTSAAAGAFAVGRLGATTPAFQVDASTGSQVAGLKVTGAATAGTVAVVVTDSGADANLIVNAKGSGTIGIGSVSTGRVTITPVTTITGALTLSATLGAVAANFSGLVTANLGLTVASGQTLTVTGATITATTEILLTSSTAGDAVWVRNTSASGYSAILFRDSSDVAAGAFFYGNSAVAAVNLRGKFGVFSDSNFYVYVNSDDSAPAFSVATTKVTTFGAGVVLSSTLTYGGVALAAAVTGTGNMVLSASPTFTGTVVAAAIAATGVLSTTSSLAIAAEQKFFLDGVGASGNTYIYEVSADAVDVVTGGVVSMRVSAAAAGQTALAIYDVDNANLERVTVGAADSGGVGFKLLRIPN